MFLHVHVKNLIILVKQVYHYQNVSYVIINRFLFLENFVFRNLDHRKHGNRVIKEFLLGKKLTNYINQGAIKSQE